MSAERWILVGTSDHPEEEALKKAISQSDHRGTCVHSVQECVAIIQRRTFLCAFFDRPMFAEVSRRCSFSAPTYTVLVVNEQDVPKALAQQNEGKIHDWIQTPLSSPAVAAVISRAHTFLRTAGELEAVKAAAAKAIRKDATLLCSGKWADRAGKWMEKVKNGNEPLLLAGEVGCGKRLLARLLHYSSSRASDPFIVVRCKERNPQELERQIFGEIPPRDRPPSSVPLRSTFSLAAHGTVLFDKAEHLPRRIQQRLRQAMVTRTFSPVGGGDRLKMDSRLIFTVQENGKEWSVNKIFQKDLAKLLKNSMLRIPPLRERREDLHLIAENALEKLRRENGAKATGITEKAMDLIRHYAWPGNIREMEGVLGAASLIAGASNISMRAITPFVSNGDSAMKDEERALEELIEARLTALFKKFGVDHLKDIHPMVMERVEKPLFSLVLRQTGGNQVRAAKLLGINRNTLRRKLSLYDIQQTA